MPHERKPGVLLMNTGSPDAPETQPTRKYLRQFLSDPRVIDISPAGRWFLLNFIILPFRPKQSAHAYQQIWTENGSPLIVNSEAFRDGLRERLPHTLVEIGMAYGEPSIPRGIDQLIAQGVDRIVAVPMFPQYASATFGSVLEAVYKYLAEKQNVVPLTVVPPFYDDPRFLDAWAEVAEPHLDAFKPDHVLVSYHGLPVRQIYKADPTGEHCLKKPDCCARYLDGNPNCYRAHCIETTRGVAERLGLAPKNYTVVFQSKLGRDPWLEPALDASIPGKANAGVKRLAILSPAFVADCLETLEEIGMRGRDDFLEAGGEEFLLVPSLNAHPAWLDAAAGIIAPYAAPADAANAPKAAAPAAAAT